MITERSIQNGLMVDIRSRIRCACPNFTPAHWWECDLWAVTKAGYVVEYEVKLSLADFTADARKSQMMRVRNEDGSSWETRNKHAMLAAGTCVPSRFFYVVPKELRETIEPRLPEWAGLITAQDWPSHSWSPCRQVKPAPRLHKGKVSDGEVQRAMVSMYYRYWESVKTIERLKRDIDAAERMTA